MVCSCDGFTLDTPTAGEGPMEPAKGVGLGLETSLPSGHAVTRPTAAMQGAVRMPDMRKGILHGLTVRFSRFSMARRPWQRVLAHSGTTVPPGTAPPHTAGCRGVSHLCLRPPALAPLLLQPLFQASLHLQEDRVTEAAAGGACEERACRPAEVVVLAANDSEAGFMRTAVLLPPSQGRPLGLV